MSQTSDSLRNPHSELAYIRQKDLLNLVPISASSLWRYVRDGRFPAPVKLGPRVTAWHRPTVEAFLAQKTPEQ